MTYTFNLHQLFKKPSQFKNYSALHILKSSYETIHNEPPQEIDSKDIKENGFLISNEEKEKLLFYMAQHDGKNEVIPNKLATTTPGAVLINRDNQHIYKIYKPETKQEKQDREHALKWGLFQRPKGCIGQGGFGKLYLCQDLISGEWCVVKIIRKTFYEKLGFVTGLNKFYQPNEVQFLKEEGLYKNAVDTANKYYLVEKLINGKDLRYLNNHNFFDLKNKEKSTITLFEILEKILQAVTQFHSHNSIHADISPDNFLYDTTENKIYLIDFGLSLKIPSGKHSVQLSVSYGKQGYIAPEISDDGIYSQASDIYSLGKTFSDIVSQLPFLGKDFSFLQDLKRLTTNMCNRDQAYRPTLDEIGAQLLKIKKIAMAEFHPERHMQMIVYDEHNVSPFRPGR